MGKPKNEVFPKPAVIIKQPVSFLDQPNHFPRKLKNKKETANPIQAIPIGKNR
jgi:hypothetical protein